MFFKLSKKKSIRNLLKKTNMKSKINSIASKIKIGKYIHMRVA